MVLAPSGGAWGAELSAEVDAEVPIGARLFVVAIALVTDGADDAARVGQPIGAVCAAWLEVLALLARRGGTRLHGAPAAEVVLWARLALPLPLEVIVLVGRAQLMRRLASHAA